MNLTFKGFLKGYLRELSGQGSLSLARLVSMAESGHSRLTEPLACYTVAAGKADYALRLGVGKFAAVLADVRLGAHAHGSLEGYLASSEAPARLQKVWLAYLSVKDAAKADHRVVALMAQKTSDALAQSGVSAYRMCADLGLNAGNVYACLRGDPSKLSRATARKMLEYAQSLPGASA